MRLDLRPADRRSEPLAALALDKRTALAELPPVFSSRALMAFQNAMTTVGHNVANAGTEGYHRQRVDLRQSLPEISAWGALGTGVRVDSVQRIEDTFIELAIQREAPVLSRFDAQTGALKQAELVFGEPSDSGIT